MLPRVAEHDVEELSPCHRHGSKPRVSWLNHEPTCTGSFQKESSFATVSDVLMLTYMCVCMLLCGYGRTDDHEYVEVDVDTAIDADEDPDVCEGKAAAMDADHEGM